MRIVFLILLACGVARAESWPMFQHDMQHTGRAGFSVPASRLNTGFFDDLQWQTVLPGGVGASSPVFYDQAGGSAWDVVAVGYHWPKGLKVVNRRNGQSFWQGLPAGGERIGDNTPAFNPGGSRIYLTNDATENGSFPNGRPLMAVASLSGPTIQAHNGGMVSPQLTSIFSPLVAPDGRIFLHQWGGYAGAARDDNSTLSLAWSSATPAEAYYSDPALFTVGSQLRVVSCARNGWIRCYDGDTGAELWSRQVDYSLDASPTVDPANNHIYVGAGTEHVGVVGLDADGNLLWSEAATRLFTRETGVNEAQRAQSAGCLAHDGSTYYFQTVATDASGALYAVNTDDGSLKWSVATGSRGGEEIMASPIVTQNDVVIVGNNLGGAWWAIRDLGPRGVVLDHKFIPYTGPTRSSPTLSSEGDLYMPEYDLWTVGNASTPHPDHALHNLLSARDLRAWSCALANPVALTGQTQAGLIHLNWEAVEDPSACFLRYDIYRSNLPLFETQGLTPLAAVSDRLAPTYTDNPGPGGWYYAVVSVSQDGHWDPALQAGGPLGDSQPPDDRWAMQQRDQEHTGRAWFEIPASRQNDQLFETCRWQTPLPGPVGGSSPLFTQAEGEQSGRVAVGYHWPKGVQVMERATGLVQWALNPAGGETIGEFSGALSADNGWIYLTNDATESPEWPNGTPVMALDLLNGNLRAHSGDNPDPGLVSRPALTLGDDGRVYAHGWGLGPAGLTDQGDALAMDWTPWSQSGHYYNGVALQWWQGVLRAVTAGEGGQVECWSTQNEDLLWSRESGVPLFATTTLDPATGRVYVPAGSGNVGVVGLGPEGQPLWGAAYQELYSWDGIPGNEQRAQAGGCLSHDGATFYFQTNSNNGTGRLYAVNTADGSLKWSLETNSAGWERPSSCPLVTPNGILIVGNNWDRWFAVRDDGASPTVLDVLDSALDTATGSPALTADGLLFLNTRSPWIFPNGLEMPDHEQHDLLAAVDLGESPWTVTPLCTWQNPASLSAVALNESVRLSWTPVNVAAECFDRYRVYREPGPFESVDGLSPVAELEGVETAEFLDEGLGNGDPLWYAVVGVNLDGGFEPAVTAVGPRTPHWRFDLQVACIRRGPQYPRYAVAYTGHEITEPGGFGPYLFSAATGLDQGQGCEDPRQPQPGDPVTWTAIVRNCGTTTFDGELPWGWDLDGENQLLSARVLQLAPGDTAMFHYTRTWDGEAHTLRFGIDPWDEGEANNFLEQDAWSVAFKTYADRSQLESFRELTGTWPSPRSDDMIDWLQRHMARFNELFALAGVPKRVHYDLLQVLEDTAPDPSQPPDNLFGIFPFRYRAGEGDPRLSGYYNQNEDIDYGLLHELAHQLGLIDVYQFDVPAEANQVSGLSYWAHDDLMHVCSPLINSHSAAGMSHWDRAGHGYYGQYLYGLPQTLTMRFLDYQGNPLADAQVEVFQYCERPGQGKVISNQVKFSGTTDSNGLFTLPNVDIDESLAPETCLGDALHDNPFGYVAVVGTNGVLHFRVRVDERTDYAWLDISEANVAYYSGQTEEAIFERQLLLGGDPDYFLDADNCEGSAGRWSIATNGENTLTNDATERVVGLNSLKADTQGDFLTLIYPGNRMGRYDLSGCDSLAFWTRVENDWDFQMRAPQIRLYTAGDAYVEYLPDYDLLTGAGLTWTRLSVPLAGGDGWTRTESGTPDLGLVNSVEFFADTWEWAFTWWLDGLQFIPACCATDCNGNGLRDCDDIASGFSLDLNGDQVPDECQCGLSLPAPALEVALAGDQLRLTWNAVTQDEQGCPLANPLYHLWSSPESDGPWSELLTTTGLSVDQALAGLRGFYRLSVSDAPTAAGAPGQGAVKPVGGLREAGGAR